MIFRMTLRFFGMAGLATCLLASASSLQALAQDKAIFGSKDPHLLQLKGAIYFLPNGTGGMPADLEKQKVEGYVYADRLDVPRRSFTEGFPGVTKRFEWFGLLYKGTFQVAHAGAYHWRLGSDDGSRLWIDGKEIINNDGVQAFSSQDGDSQLAKGPHTMKVWFYQGPAVELGLQLWVTQPGGKEGIFSMKDFSAGVSEAMWRVKAEATAEGIRVRMDAQVLFDSGKYDLKPTAQATLADVAKIIASYPGCAVRIEGHTDAQGDDAMNQKLSEDRASCVKGALAALPECKGAAFRAAGFGKGHPVATNDTDAGRAKNRRVEILIVPKK